jgi:hypothetical protein
MKAIHVNWTKPFFERHRLRGHGFKIQRELSSDYDQPDYQLLYTILSILRWKQLNGPIKLYTDTTGLNFYKQYDIDYLYDEINIEVLNNYAEVDAAHFWTSGKIHCLQFETQPFTFLDQDFIVRNKLPRICEENDIVIGHWEIPRGYYYFTKDQFEKEITHYKLPETYNPNAWIPNTSFLCINNLEIIKEYVAEHKKMVTTNDQVPEWFWLLTDQGVLGQCFRDGRYKVDSLTDRVFLSDSDYGDLKSRNQGLSEAWYLPLKHDSEKDRICEWEHVWLAKVVYGKDPNKMLLDCVRFYDEIWSNFPEYRMLLEHPRLCKYKTKKHFDDTNS